MKIYTKQGDAGETGLYGGMRVSKDDLRVKVYGTLDELNAVLGVVLTEATLAEGIRIKLIRIQNELFTLGSELATPREKKVAIQTLSEAEVTRLEHEIDEMEKNLSPLKNFILPGGCLSSAHLHFARSVSRRAERELITLHHDQPVRALVLQYVNRLSDYLFVIARFANFKASVQDILWQPKS